MSDILYTKYFLFFLSSSKVSRHWRQTKKRNWRNNHIERCLNYYKNDVISHGLTLYLLVVQNGQFLLALKYFYYQALGCKKYFFRAGLKERISQ